MYTLVISIHTRLKSRATERSIRSLQKYLGAAYAAPFLLARKLMNQATIDSIIVFQGIGVHSGAYSKLVLHPAESDFGIVFRNAYDHAQFITIGKVVPLKAMHATVLSVNGWALSTVEHLLAALYVCGITNLLIDVYGGEIPILDGSALPFYMGIQNHVIKQERKLKIIKPARILEFNDNEGRCMTITPVLDHVLTLDYEADFQHPRIGRQSMKLALNKDIFSQDIAPARTFGFLEQLPFLRHHKLGLGTSLGNSLVYGMTEPLNQPRFIDECVRHKVLDLIGDLALIGGFLCAAVAAVKTSHSFNRVVVEDIVKHPENWLVE